MADRTGEPGRFRKLAQAALNADATVDQVNVILTDMATALDGFDRGLRDFDGTLTRLDDTLDDFVVTLARVDRAVDRLDEIVTRMADVVTRVERIVDLGERALSPVLAVELGVRRVVAGVVGVAR